MAGKEINDYFSAGDYDHFYKLFHTLSEVILSRCSLSALQGVAFQGEAVTLFPPKGNEL